MPKEISSAAFALKEELAWEWVMRSIVFHEMSDMHDPVATDLPPISMMWKPRDVGEEDTTFLLIRGAQDAGVLTAPAHVELDFEFIDDGDSGYFRYLLRVDEPAHLIVASSAEEMRHLGEPDAAGIDAALELLREAADAGNRMYQQLSTFITAATSQRR